MVRICDVVLVVALLANVSGYILARAVDDLVRVEREDVDATKDRALKSTRSGDEGLSSLTGNDGGLKRENTQNKAVEANKRYDPYPSKWNLINKLTGDDEPSHPDDLYIKRENAEDRYVRRYRPYEDGPVPIPNRWNTKRSGDGGLSPLVDGGLKRGTKPGEASKRYDDGPFPYDHSHSSDKDGGLKRESSKDRSVRRYRPYEDGPVPIPNKWNTKRSGDGGLSPLVDDGLKREKAKDRSVRRYRPYEDGPVPIPNRWNTKRSGDGGLSPLVDGGLKRESFKDRSVRRYRPWGDGPMPYPNQLNTKRSDDQSSKAIRAGDKGLASLTGNDGGLKRENTQNKAVEANKRYDPYPSKWNLFNKLTGDDEPSHHDDPYIKREEAKDRSVRRYRPYEDGPVPIPNRWNTKRSGDGGLSPLVDGGLKRENSKDRSVRRYLSDNKASSSLTAGDGGLKRASADQASARRDTDEKYIPGKLEAELYSLLNEDSHPHSKRTNDAQETAGENDIEKPTYNGSAFNFYRPGKSVQ